MNKVTPHIKQLYNMLNVFKRNPNLINGQLKSREYAKTSSLKGSSKRVLVLKSFSETLKEVQMVISHSN